MKLQIRSFGITASLLAVAITNPVAASAQSHPQPQHVVPRDVPAPAARPVRPAKATSLEHKMFGVIDQVTAPTTFVLHRRNGKFATVDYSVAYQNGNYSDPIFVGKFVLVTGTVDSAGVVHATVVNRLNYVDVKSTLPDE